MNKIMPCTCKHEYQDLVYGPGKRVHVARMKDRKLLGWRCTVCGSKKDPSSADKELTTKKKEEETGKKV